MKITSAKFLKSVVTLTPEISPLKENNLIPQVFFLGRSNVGKSSLINSLFGQKGLARSSAQAGKTQTINFFEVNETYECLDFPGYGYARGGKEKMLELRDMIVDYLEANISHRTRIVQVIDAYVGPTDIDREVYSYLIEKNADVLLVLNKADKANQKELEATRKLMEDEFFGVKYVFYSCVSKKFQEGVLETIFDGLKPAV